jgi:hypothetical protein
MKGLRMSRKQVAIAASFIGVGFISLLFYYLLPAVSSQYLFVAYAFIFILIGQTIFGRIVTRAYPAKRTTFKEGFILGEDVHFFVIEFTKVIAVVVLTFSFPLEAFAIWVILDCLDGLVLPYKKRSLTLRHQIDKLTDLLCQIPFFFLSLYLWPQLTVLFSIFFILTIINMAGYLTSGNRDVLVYVPNAFIFLYIIALGAYLLYPTWFTLLFGDTSTVIILTAVLLLAGTIYEVVYNGIFMRLRYRVDLPEKRWRYR